MTIIQDNQHTFTLRSIEQLPERSTYKYLVLNYGTILLVVSYLMFQVLIPFPSLNQNVKHMLSTKSECDLTELFI